MKLLQTHRLLLLCLLLVLSGMGAEGAAKQKKRAVAAPVEVEYVDPLSHEDRLRYNYIFLEAVNKGNAGQYDAAFDLLCRCVQIDSTAAEAYFMRSTYYLQMDQDSMALRDLQHAAALRPGNDTYQERLAQMYINNNQLEQATSVYEQLASQKKDRGDLLAILIQLYKIQKNYDSMLKAIERLERVEGEDDQFALMRLNVYELQRDEVKALRVLRELADSHPNDMNFTVMLGNWLMHHNAVEEAGELFAKAIRTEPDNASAQSSIYDYYRATGQQDLADDMVERILLSKKTTSDNRVQFLRQTIVESEKQGGDSLKILQLFDRIQTALPGDKDVAELKVAYYALKQMPDSMQNIALGELLEVSPDNGGARYQLIQNLWAAEKWEEVARHSEMGMLYNPDEMGFYYFAGLARYYAKDDQAALSALRKATANIKSNSNANLVSEIYAIMGEIYHTNGDTEQAYAAYDSCLHWRPDHISTLNNYAYYLSLDGRDLKRAEAMSAKTIQAEPRNSTYLDTYAWVLYKEERYAEAKIYIDQALLNMGDSAVSADILDHAGDVYLKNSLGDEAVEYWRKAIEADGDEAAIQAKINLYLKRKK